VDAREYRGMTALHLAAYKGHIEVVHLLLSHGADRAATGSKGETAQLLAEEGGHGQVVEALTAVT
jgi:ankyrin repeat protein